MMTTIYVKLDKVTLRKIDENLGNKYATREDFIRAAIKEKLRKLEKESAIRELEKNLGAAKTKVSDKRHEEIREEVTRKHAKKFGLGLD